MPASSPAAKKNVPTPDAPGGYLLEVRRFIKATPERVFRAWTTPDELRAWWGPAGVRCISAECDLRTGGHYRIGNELPDKTILWISGVYERIDAPQLLVYTWKVGDGQSGPERVTVTFAACGEGTDITIRHERIASRDTRDSHAGGWHGCLDGLAGHLA